MRAAMARLSQVVDKLCSVRGAPGTFLDEIVMEEVLSELKEIASRNGVSCECGSHKFRLSVNFSSIDVVCAECGAMARIPAATMDDVERICCKNHIIMKKI